MAYTKSEKRILADLKQAEITWGMQLEMARKYNQGDTTFAELGANSRQRAHQIVNKIRKMDVALLERITKIAQENNLF
jgi:hypothetical protein